MERSIGGKAQVANCVTPAGGRTVTLYIGSTIMTVNGANIIMDAALTSRLAAPMCRFVTWAKLWAQMLIGMR